MYCVRPHAGHAVHTEPSGTMVPGWVRRSEIRTVDSLSRQVRVALTAGSRRGPSRPTPSMLARRERTGRAVLGFGHDGDGRRSGASFGARAGTAGGTHNTGYRARLRMLFDRRWRHPALAPVDAPRSTHRGRSTSVFADQLAIEVST